MNNLPGVTDIHQHVLPGLDDGPKTPEESLEMLKLAKKQNVLRIAATPHACPGFVPFDIDVYNERLSELQNASDKECLGIKLFSGAEIAWTYQTVEALRNGSVPTLNGTDYALIELWADITWAQVREAALMLLRAGFSPVFAHVERYRCFLWQPDKAVSLKRELPVYYQMNAGFLLSANGLIAKRFLKRMLGEQAIDAVASDAHNVQGRRIRLDEAFRKLNERAPRIYTERLFTFNGVFS